MPENTYTIKVETAAAEKNVQVLLDKVNELVAALGKLAQATSGGILSNPEAVGSMQALSQAQGGGAPSGIGGGSHAGATVGAARAQATGPQAPTVAPTGFPSGTTNPAPPVSNIGTSPGGGTAPSGIVPPSGRQTGAAPGTRSGPSYSDLQKALATAEAAYAANPSDDTRYDLAQAQARMGRARNLIDPPVPVPKPPPAAPPGAKGPATFTDLEQAVDTARAAHAANPTTNSQYALAQAEAALKRAQNLINPPQPTPKPAPAPKPPKTPAYTRMQQDVDAAQAAFDADPSDANQYALLQAQDRLSRANRRMNPPGPAGFNWTSSAFARTGAGFIIGQSAVSYASGWFDIAGREQLRGGVEWQERGRQAGMGWGAALGGAAGFFLGGGPVGALIGGTLGSQLGGAVGAWATAGQQARDDAMAAIAPNSMILGRPSVYPFEQMAKQFQGFNMRGYMPSASTLGGVWSQLSGGLWQGGGSPWGLAAGYNNVPTNRFTSPFLPSAGGAGLGKGGRPIGVPSASFDRSIGSSLTKVLTLQYGEEAVKQIAQEQGAILGATPETGNNIADIMTRFGPQAAARNVLMWAGAAAKTFEGVREPKDLAVNLGTLIGSSVASREAQREARIGATLQRGSGAAVFNAIGREMEAYADLPGGRDSEAYTSAHARRREARMAAYAQQDIEAYGIPATRLSTQRGVLDALPYAPGYRFGVELQSIALNRRQAGVIQTRLQRGDLTEQQQLQLEQELSGLRVASARSVAALTEGVADRLPALSAGRPTRFSRLDATQLAALNLGRMGHPGREFGAVNGAQLAAQDAFVNQMLGPGGERMIAPMGRDLPVGTERVEALLERIAQILQQNGGAGAGPRTRVGEAVNKGQAVANGNPAPSYGNGGYN